MRTRRSTGMRVIALLTALAIAPATTVAQTTDEPDETFDEELESLQEFGQLSLEELMAIPVTSIMGTEQALLDSPAAIYVISNEDLRRGGYRTIADALRMVPGMQVGQVTSNIWAVTSRGFNGRFGDMLLVLIDGRAVYTPLFAGVFWDVQDVVMEDVDRIEVIRGPGATLWGANAVNGVINIVTRSAEETQGLLITAGGGDHEQGFGALRYGGQIADNAWFRVWTKYDNRNHFENAAGISQPDDWHTWRTGFRLDVEPDSDTTLQFQAELFDGGHGNLWNVAAPTAPFSATVRDDLDRDGGHLLAKVMRDVSATTGWSLLAYYDMDRFSSSVISEDRRTYDIEFRHHTLMGDRHELVWGLGYRHYEDETTGSFALSFVPPDRSFGKFSAFIQDQIELEPDRWSLLIGSKFEHNDFTGFEVQPSARLLWTPDDNQAVWASVSRAVRTPARNEDELNLVLDVVPPGTPARLLGNRDVESETLIAYEAGYRVRPSDTLTVDVAAFFNDYDNLITITGPGPTPPDVSYINNQTGESYGLELSVKWDVADNWRLSSAYTWFDLHLHGGGESAEGSAPEHQFNVRSHLDITNDLEFNAGAYFVDHVPTQGAGSYTRLDLGLTWRPSPNIEFAIWGQNLLDGSHLEFTDPFLVGTPIEVQRGVYGQVTFRF